MRRLTALMGLLLALTVWQPARSGDDAVAPRPPASHEPIRLVPDEPEPSFDALGRAEGLPSSTVYRVHVDRHGFVWMAGNGGVHRFDGRSVHTLDRDPDRPDSLASRTIGIMTETEDGIWIGSPDGTVQRLDARTGRLTVVPVVRSPDGARPQWYGWMDRDVRGRIWMLSDLGVLRLDPVTGAVVAADPKVLVPYFASATHIGGDGRRLFAATGDFRVLALDVDDPRTSTTLLTLPKSGQAPITALVTSGDVLWLVAGTQLWRFDLGDASLRKIAMPVHLPRATTMVIARDGALWMGSAYDEGLVRFNPARGELSIYRSHPGDPQSLRSSRIMSLAIDDHDNLWIGLGINGASRLRLGQHGVVRYRLEGSRSQDACAMHAGDDRQLLIAFCGGSLGRLDLDIGHITDLTAELDRGLAAPAPTLTATVLVADGDGGFWIPTTSAGLLHWQPQRRRTTRYSIIGEGPVPLPDPWMGDAMLDAKQRLWVGHVRGLAVLEPGARALRNVVAKIGAETKGFGPVTDVSPGPQGSLWLGTTHGVVHYRPDQQRARLFQYERDNPGSLSDNFVVVTHTDSAGRVWIGTQAGLNRMIVDKSGAIRFRRYNKTDGLPDMTIDAIVNDASGALWVGTDRGLARWDSALDRFQSFLPADGVPDNSINWRAALLGRDGSLYFGSYSGILKIDPARLRAADPAPVVLSSYEIGGTTTINLRGRALQPLHASYTDASVGFRVALLGNDRRLSYRLLGLDDRWQDMPADLAVRYHRLPLGDYRFQVRQMDSTGRWREPDLSVPLSVAPPPWRSLWAYLAYAAAALTVLALLRQSYVRRRRKRREHIRALRERDERLTLALWASGDVMIDFELESDRVNHVGERFLGYRPEDLPTRIADYLELIHPDDAASVARFIEAQRGNQDREQDIEYRLRSADGETIWVRMRGRPVQRDAGGDSRRSFAGMVSNIAEERRSRESLRRMANYDVLTGLPNRSRFQSDLTALIENVSARPMALLFIDLDRFKNVNDSLGHQFGDKVLIAAAKRLSESLPPTAAIARLGGDEFTVILADCRHESEAAATASRLLEAFERPLRADASEVVISASIGISLFPAHATDATLLVQYADSAMYYAKESGRNAFRIFQPEMVARVSRRLALETALRRALERGELYPVFQPRLDIASGRPCGAEVLLRWRSAEFGQVSPAEFIPILEDTGVIEGVGLWLLDNVARQLNAWSAAGFGDLVISLNVSVHQLTRGRLSERLAELLATNVLPRRMLELEITESAIMENADRMKAALVELKGLDLRLSIDDFGTGYSSFAHLSQLPFHTLKIDKMLIDGIGESERADTLCAAIIAMAHNLRLSVVAEGVEHESQMQSLRAMGCDELQGFWYAKPLPCEEFEGWLVAQRANS